MKITVSKDRPGHVRQHGDESGRVAELRLVTGDDDSVTITVEPPDALGEGDAFRPTTLMERVSRAVEEAPGLSRNAIESSVRGKTDYKRLALELLIAEGFVRVERDGPATRHHSVAPYREAEEA